MNSSNSPDNNYHTSPLNEPLPLLPRNFPQRILEPPPQPQYLPLYNNNNSHNASSSVTTTTTIAATKISKTKQPKEHHQLDNILDDKDADDRTRLISQNKKLKSWLKELASAMQNLLQKDKDYKTKPKKPVKELAPAELLEVKRERLRQHQIQVHEMKTGISHLRRLIDVSVEAAKLYEKEEELRVVRREQNQLLEEREILLKVKQEEQCKNEKYIACEEEYEKQMKSLRENVKKLKDDNKELLEKLTAKDKLLKKLQDQNNLKEDKIKELNNKIKDRNKILENAEQNDVTDEAIADLTTKIKELEAEKKRNESKYQEDLTKIAKEKLDTSSQYGKKVAQAKEKERKQILQHLVQSKAVLVNREKEAARMTA